MSTTGSFDSDHFSAEATSVNLMEISENAVKSASKSIAVPSFNAKSLKKL